VLGHPEDVGRQPDAGDAVLVGRLDHAPGFGHVGRPVVPIRKEVRVEIDHVSARPL
jgi:hypothetical protein